MIEETTYPAPRERSAAPAGGAGWATGFAPDAPRFWGGVVCAAVAGQLGHCQIFNPPASGGVVRVDRIAVPVGANIWLEIRRHDTALATLSARGVPQVFDGGMPRAELRSGASVAAVGTFIAEMQLVSFTLHELVRTTPLVLSPGQGLVVLNSTANALFRMHCEWTESLYDSAALGRA
jgi:hypothetical protein